MTDYFQFDDDWVVIAQENVDDVIAVQFWNRRGGPSIPAAKYVPTRYIELVELDNKLKELELA